MTCRCERVEHPRGLRIAAGLTRLPRQVATFDDFRRAMLAEAPSRFPLRTWREQPDDLGVLLLEMWAIVGDALAFYDEVHAHEAYVRTARLDPSVRKLVALLGYLPRPATAAGVSLAVLADGRRTVTVPAGAAARSGAFDGEPPQLFETPAAATVHPLANQWKIEASRRLTAGSPTEAAFFELHLDRATSRVKAGDVLLVQVTGDESLTQVRRVTTVEPVTAEDGEAYVRAAFAQPVTLNQTPVANVRLSRVNERIALWSQVVSGSGNPQPVTDIDGVPELTLDGAYRQIKRDDVILISRDGEYRWTKVAAVADEQLIVVAATSIITTSTVSGTTTTNTITVPAVLAPATRLVLDAGLNAAARNEGHPFPPTWVASDSARLIVHYGLTSVGQVVVPANAHVGPGDALRLQPPVEQPPDAWAPSRFVLVDRNGVTVDAAGSLDYATRALTLDAEATWSPPLVLPVDVYGNVVEAERGETVPREILGSGDGSAASQWFALKKSPLTYLPVRAPDGSAVTSTLEVWVDDVRWAQARSFFGATPEDAIYIVRQDDEGKSHVGFGDGVRGRRLPTGKDNVRGRYRFGGGAKAPPAGSVSQLAKPLTGIKRWWNPQPAFGGGDAEAASSIRRYGPRSALVLGRAVSLADMEAVAAQTAGARAVRAEWRWHERQQRPVAQLWYIGLSGVATLVLSALRTVCDPSVPLDVERATAVPASMTLDVETDDRYDPTAVAQAVRDRLMEAEAGMLTPERVGIGRPLVRSRLFRDVLEVAGTRAVRGVFLNAASFDAASAAPPEGSYFDFETGGVTVNAVSP